MFRFCRFAINFAVIFTVCVGLTWRPAFATEEDHFADLEKMSDQVEMSGVKDLQILEEFNFRPFSENLPSEYQVYTYESYFKDIRPDVGVRIGRKTVDKWSRRFLDQEKSPVRHVRYEILQDYLDVIITIDFDFFEEINQLDMVAPAWAPGEVFKRINDRKPYQKFHHSKEPFVFDIRFRLRFPLIGYQSPNNSGSLNTVHMEFTKQAIQTYYLKDFNTYLELSSKRIAQIDHESSIQMKQTYGGDTLSPDKKLSKASEELDYLISKYSRDGDLSSTDKSRLKEIQRFLNSEDSLQIAKESTQELAIQIENFKASCLLPIVPSAAAIKHLIEIVTQKGLLTEYLDMEIVTHNDQAGGVLKISGLNRVIEANLPQVDVFFVGVDQRRPSSAQYFGQESSKLFVAARMR